MIIRNLRLQHALSQEQLASITNLSTRTIQRIEKDNHASFKSLNLLAQAFNMETKELQEILETKKEQQIPDKQEAWRKKTNQKFISFFLVNLMLFAINMLTNPHYLWFLYPLLGWGIPLFYKRIIKHKFRTINAIS